MSESVKIWEEKVIIPTYPVGKPEKNPMFLEKRIYQGSSGVVYPNSIIEKIYDSKADKIYNAVFLENAYIKIMMLPELGGRIQMAYDKVKKRHFIYYNQVIKPALVGLTGPWISGGIEFNWPQHHRPSTFEAVDFTLEENSDGSKTIWTNEVERMFRTKGLAGITLYPDKAFIEIKVKLYNRTPFPQTFLWWANPAIKANDYYQSIFPPDVYAVYDHGKRDVSLFPIAKGIYYKTDYAPGTDISRYKNIPVPTSYMAIASKFDFIGGYDHQETGGVLHIADHHISPGKKQWTWGNGEFGKAWDRNLTDEDGPYVELMAGVFTDNQPDFSWIQPFEEKSFTQYFLPYREVGVVKNATIDAALGFEILNKHIVIKIHFTAVFENVKINVLDKDNEIFSDITYGSPEVPYQRKVLFSTLGLTEEISLEVINNVTGKVLVSYKQSNIIDSVVPSPAIAAKLPMEIECNEQLYLTGLHIEQYRHATYIAKDYYEEALRRDDRDIRNNNALGLWFLRRGRFEKSEGYFRKAIKTLTQFNPNPSDGEPYYNLGCVLHMQGLFNEAIDAFYKCVWNDAWQHAGFFHLARIFCAQGKISDSLNFIERSILKNYYSHSARHLKVVLLRKSGCYNEAHYLIHDSLVIDPFNFGCIFEKYNLFLAEGKSIESLQILDQLKGLSRCNENTYFEYAFDYIHAGCFEEALAFLLVNHDVSIEVSPMMYYYLGWISLQINKQEEAFAYFLKAESARPDYCFPNRIEDINVLLKAMEMNSADAKAPYYLGNFWYDKRQYPEAISLWEKSAFLNNTFPTVYRNLGLAYFNKVKDSGKALTSMEKAFSLDKADARVLMELDQLYKILNTSHHQRIVLLDQYFSLVKSRDDLFLEYITLLNNLKQFEKAKALIEEHKFHPWEGGEGKVIRQFLICNIELAKIAIVNGEFEIALNLLCQAENYPLSISEGKLPGTQENDIHYFKGLVFELSGSREKAVTLFEKATVGISDPVQAIFYNDPQPDKIFYQGLAWLKLNNKTKAEEIFRKLKAFGEHHLNDVISIDYFAVSLPELLVFDTDLNLRNRVHCLYLMALGSFGVGKDCQSEAVKYFSDVLSYDINHQGAAIHSEFLGRFPFIQF